MLFGALDMLESLVFVIKYLAKKNCIADRLTDFLMDMGVFGGTKVLATRLRAQDYLGKHVLSRFLIANEEGAGGREVLLAGLGLGMGG